MERSIMPALDGILETALYVDDLDRARRFYENVLALAPMFVDDRLCAYGVARSVLLLFPRKAVRAGTAAAAAGPIFPSVSTASFWV